MTMTEKGLPIRNVTADPLGGEMRKRAEEWLYNVAPDARFIGDDALMSLKYVEWPDGTEVVAYCHRQDREAVSRDIEKKGYKIAAFVDIDNVWFGGCMVKPGQYMMAKRMEQQWDNRKPYHPYNGYATAHDMMLRGMMLADEAIWNGANKRLKERNEL